MDLLNYYGYLWLLTVSSHVIATFFNNTKRFTKVQKNTLSAYVSVMGSAPSSLVCAGECAVNDACNAFSFSNSTCSKLNPFLMEDPDSSATSAPVHLACPNPKVTGSKLLLIGGCLAGCTISSGDVEVIDLASATGTNSCAKPASVPRDLLFASGGLVCGAPVVCGGASWVTAVVSANCSVYDGSIDAWLPMTPLPLATYDAGSAVVVNQTMLVFGGIQANASITKVAQAYDFAVGMDLARFELPVPVVGHCMARINETHVMLVGGFYAYGVVVTWMFFMLDLTTGQFTQRAPLPAPKYHHFCGFATRSDGAQLIVAAGGSVNATAAYYVRTTFIYDLATDAWSSGPDLPAAQCCNPSVPYKDSFLVVGYNVLYYYDPDAAAYVTLPQQIANPRYYSQGFMVPDNLVKCS